MQAQSNGRVKTCDYQKQMKKDGRLPFHWMMPLINKSVLSGIYHSSCSANERPVQFGRNTNTRRSRGE